MPVCKRWSKNVLPENVRDVWKRIGRKKKNVKPKLRVETQYLLLRSSPIVINVMNPELLFKDFKNVDGQSA